jgi:hypothetical protein
MQLPLIEFGIASGRTPISQTHMTIFSSKLTVFAAALALDGFDHGCRQLSIRAAIAAPFVGDRVRAQGGCTSLSCLERPP